MTDTAKEPGKNGGLVFISYATPDREIANKIKTVLVSKEIKGWMAPQDIAGGGYWPDEISKAISQSRIMILVLSKNTQKSDFVKKEVTLAAEKKIIIIPFCIEDVSLSGGVELLLVNCHRIKAFPKPKKKHLEQLIETVLCHLRKPGSDKRVEEPEKKRAPKVKLIYKYIYEYVEDKRARVYKYAAENIAILYVGCIIIVIAAILAFFIFKSSTLNRQYNEFISSAKTFIESKDWEKAGDALEKAKEIKNTPEIERLWAEIAGNKRIENMKREFDDLKTFLNGQARNKDKLEKCREFLSKHQNITGNKDIQEMRDDTNRFISELNADIKVDEQYQKLIDDVNNLIKSGDYEKAEKELNNARKIKDSDEVKRLSVTIIEGIEKEQRDGEKDYKAIKDKLNLSRFQAFQRNYPLSVHLQELRDRLKAADKNLPPDKYWDKPIRKNEKGYYEITFGNEHNGHQMIYIPEKEIWIDKYEVSWAQFKNFLKAAKIQFPPIPEDKIISSGNEYPAVVIFKDAQNYCPYGLRLPTKAEWEYAAGEGKFTYPWGNESPDESGIWRANYDSLEGVVEKDGFEGTATVKSFEKFSSPFGVVNMAGNVWEWVQGNTLKGGGILSSIEDLKIKSSKPGNNDKEGFRCVKDEK